MFGLGWFFFLRQGVLVVGRSASASPASPRQWRTVLRKGLPLLVAIVGAVRLETLISRTMPGVPFEWGVIVALVLATFAGYTGVIISPIHICFLLNCRYFGVDLAGAWRRLFAPCLLFALSGCLHFRILLG
jgi:hypothetical protein